jgi:uncharacterized membrane protein
VVKAKRRLDGKVRPDERIQATLMIIVLAYGVLTVAPVILGDRVVEPFSELGLLGPEMKLGDYPRDIVLGESVDLFLYLGNHEGDLMYYRVYVKQGDQLMNVSDTEPYPGVVLSQYDYVLGDEFNTTMPISVMYRDPGVNQRMVFELYKYYPEANVFRYDGIWVQLWMNVTTPQ